MEEAKVIIGIMLIAAVTVTGYFVLNSGAEGAVPADTQYMACCCNILATDGIQLFVRNQIQTWAYDCLRACRYYQDAVVGDKGTVFAQEGLCAANP